MIGAAEPSSRPAPICLLAMSHFQTIMSITSAVMLFIYGLQALSREIQEVGEGVFQSLTERLTKTRVRGYFLGLLLTVFIQSSTAVSGITVALIDAGAITFSNSLAVLLGAHIGTTLTAFLVSLKMTGIGPFFIVLGSLLSFLPLRARIFGRAIFYFGFVLFALDFLSSALLPLRESELLRELLGASASMPLAVLIGFIVTALVQSSSVTTGLAVILAQQGAIAAPAAVGVVVGANIGTPLTAIIISVKMSPGARRAAVANLLYSAITVLVLFPFLGPFASLALELGGEPGRATAVAHLLFNVILSVGFMIFLTPFERLMLRLIPAG